MKNKIGKYCGNEFAYVEEVLNSDVRSATAGSWNRKLEAMFSEKFGVSYAISQNSGTSALHSCLAVAGIRTGDEVICPALTVVMDTFAIIYQNAKPVFADIDPLTFNINPESIRKKITSKTKAIITVSLYGLPCDMNPIMEIAKEFELIVIEDNAQCFLGEYYNRYAGAIGDMAIFSFENSKHMSVGEGGIAITNNEKFAEKIRKFAGIGYKNLQAGEGRIKLNEEIFQNPDYKRHDTLGWNYRMPEICAAVAVAQLERLDEIVQLRQDIAKLYDEAIDGCAWLIPQYTPSECTHTYWSYALRYEGDKRINVSWKDFYLTHKNLGGDGFYAAWSLPYEEPVFSAGKYFDLTEIDCPVAKIAQKEIMQFKTNYRDIDLAKEKIKILGKTIQSIG